METYELAAEAIRRNAVTQSHVVRRYMIVIADKIESYEIELDEAEYKEPFHG